MQTLKIHRKEAGLFSEQHVNMVYDQSIYADFLNQEFSIEAFESQMEIKGKQFSAENRAVLKDVLKTTYRNMTICKYVDANIDSISDSNTFTITTGHQLSLFTGPLYFVVKILHVLKMCQELKAKYPNNNFVPVYWMATEDHDFEEIQSCNLFNQKITWESDQKGPVGRFDLNGLDEVKAKLTELFSNNSESEVNALIASFEGENYTNAMRNLVHKLFGGRGLVILDGDESKLKKVFAPIMQKELLDQFSFEAVNSANDDLLKLGAKLQVTPREINLFYIEKGIRERIIPQGNAFEVNGVGSFSQEEILGLLESNPEKFSPNVILRPVYQECILPNLTYVGGGGEIAYWLQLKGVFDAIQLPFPLIQIRNSVIWLEKSILGKLNKFDFKTEDIFKNTDAWKKEYVQNNASDELDFTEVENQLSGLTTALKISILKVDASKEQYAEAEITRLNKQIEGIKAKAIKMSKGKHESAMSAIDQVKSRVFPNGGLQERSVNFFQFCADGNVESHIEDLFSALNPFEKDLILLLDEPS